MNRKEKLLRILKRSVVLFLFVIPMFYYGGTVREAEAYCSGNKCSKCNGNGYYTTTTSSSNKTIITKYGCGNCGGSGQTKYTYNFKGQLVSTSGSYTAGSGGSHKWSSGSNGTNYRCKEPTCTTNGCWHYKCTYCGTLGATHHETIAALGHNYVNAGDVVQWTSCTNNGYRQYSCSRCGGQDGQWHLYESAWGHSYGNWYEGTDGYYHRDCARGCGASEKGDAVEYTVSFYGNTEDETLQFVPDAVKGKTMEGITLPSYAPVREGYSFLYWSPDKSNTNNTYDGFSVDLDNEHIKRVWLKKVAGSQNFEILVYSDVTVNSIPTWTSPNGQDELVWHAIGAGTWEREGKSYNYGTWIPISSHKYEIYNYVTHIYANNNTIAAATP